MKINDLVSCGRPSSHELRNTLQLHRMKEDLLRTMIVIVFSSSLEAKSPFVYELTERCLVAQTREKAKQKKKKKTNWLRRTYLEKSKSTAVFMKVKSFPAARYVLSLSAGLTSTLASPASECSCRAQSENKYPWCTCPRRGQQTVPHEAVHRGGPYGICHDLREPSFQPGQVP